LETSDGYAFAVPIDSNSNLAYTCFNINENESDCSGFDGAKPENNGRHSTYQEKVAWKMCPLNPLPGSKTWD
jgi:hypothetical protein